MRTPSRFAATLALSTLFAAGTLAAAQPPASGKPAPILKTDPVPSSGLFLGKATPVASGFKFTEGPQWVPAKGDKPGYFIFSDIPAETIHSLSIEGTGADLKGKAAVLREKTGRANGNALDPAGRVVTVESAGRLVRWSLDKPAEVEVLVADFEGKRLNSPNDVCTDKAGNIYFSDPAFFVKPDERKLDFEGLFVLRAGQTKPELVDKSFRRLNGLCLSPDEKTLYVADFGGGAIYAYALADGKPANRRTFVEWSNAGGSARPDGIKTDSAGNVYSTGPGGIWVFSPDGKPIDRLDVRGASNLAFGGADGKTLLITAGGSVLAVQTKNPGR